MTTQMFCTNVSYVLRQPLLFRQLDSLSSVDPRRCPSPQPRGGEGAVPLLRRPAELRQSRGPSAPAASGPRGDRRGADGRAGPPVRDFSHVTRHTFC